MLGVYRRTGRCGCAGNAGNPRPHLRARPWGSETQLRIERADGRRVLDFGRDMVEPPYRVRLQREGATVVIVANGLGNFEVLE